MREKALFVIRKPHSQIAEEDIREAFQQLPPQKKQQFLLLRDNASTPFTSLIAAMAENTFNLATPDGTIGEHLRTPAHGLFLLHSRFNHSCLPNSNIPTIHEGEVIARFATRDIEAGEEITFCYESHLKSQTRRERHQTLGFTCTCRACVPGTPFQQLSDMRRRFIRALEYLNSGVDSHGEGLQRSASSLIIDPELRLAAETSNMPHSSRFIYTVMSVFLQEEEGLLDDYAVKRVSPDIHQLAGFFQTKENAAIAKLAMAQDTWFERLDIAFRLYGRRDAADDRLVERFRLVSSLVQRMSEEGMHLN